MNDRQIEVVRRFEVMANVPVGALENLLLSLWGKDGHEAASKRLDEERNHYAKAAAAARKASAKRPQAGIRDVINQMLIERPRLTKTKAFSLVALDRALAPETVRNAYYNDKL